MGVQIPSAPSKTAGQNLFPKTTPRCSRSFDRGLTVALDVIRWHAPTLAGSVRQANLSDDADKLNAACRLWTVAPCQHSVARRSPGHQVTSRASRTGPAHAPFRADGPGDRGHAAARGRSPVSARDAAAATAATSKATVDATAGQLAGRLTHGLYPPPVRVLADRGA